MNRNPKFTDGQAESGFSCIWIWSHVYLASKPRFLPLGLGSWRWTDGREHRAEVAIQVSEWKVNLHMNSWSPSFPIPRILWWEKSYVKMLPKWETLLAHFHPSFYQEIIFCLCLLLFHIEVYIYTPSEKDRMCILNFFGTFSCSYIWNIP